jgi:hypothetical protein
MPYGRGQQNDRRRRVLTDLLLGSETPQARFGRRRSRHREGPIGRSENYGDAEFLHEQPRLTDLIPLRLRFFAILLVIGLGTIAGLEQLYAWRPRILQWTQSSRVAALDLAGGGTLAAWFASVVLALAGLTAILVFTVRRHKRDDYHGHYRVWLWAAACWFLMSLDAVAGLRHTLGEILISLSGTRLWGDGSLWWLIPYGFLVGGIGTRLVVDMRRCRLSTGILLVAAACYLGAISTRLGGIAVGTETLRVMLLHGAVLAGNFFVLLSMGLHGRYVLLDAQGLLPRRQDEDESAEEADDELVCEEDEEGASATGSSLMVRPPQSSPRPLSVSSGPVSALFAPAPKPAPFPPPASNSFTPAPVNRKLTKQEKRALRERLLRARQERQAG